MEGRLTGSRNDKARLYHGVVQHLEQAIESGAFPVGGRLPSERELAEQLKVSRPVVREAIIVLQSRGMVQIRHGAGVFVLPKPDKGDSGVDMDVGPFEVLEARRLLEGEIAALAAQSITPTQIGELERIVVRIGDTRLSLASREQADRAFHVALARSAGNDVLVGIVERLWDMRFHSPLCEYYFRRARESGSLPPEDEHQLVVDALKVRDGDAARRLMRDHLTSATRDLLRATEEDARDRARLKVEERRLDFARRAGLQVEGP
jgi:DNA-binding FadR family transcriptional regulator